ncbi:MAG: DUF4124 domain-containing protein [Gammaproteobacteria bacterium]|nr:DUF4124 domain-containing protein [Gammaproteobacteria bacterium]
MKLSWVLVALSTVLIYSQSTQAGKIYKWKDENGKIHFSDKPPKNKQLKAEAKSVEEVNTIVGKPQVITNPLDENGKLTPQACRKAIANINKGLPGFKRAVLAQAGGKPGVEAAINGMLNDIQVSATIDDCTNSSGQHADGYKCMVNSTDIFKCMKDNL